MEKAFHALDSDSECLLVDALRYTHPILDRLIFRTYLQIIKKRPEVWEYLYDNPWVLKNTEKLRRAIHESQSRKFKMLLDDFKPDAIVCTQAFPCGIVSDYKATQAIDASLYGVLTDYLPHSYWVFDRVDRYFVSSQEAKEKLAENGIFENRIQVTGIPIDFSFSANGAEGGEPQSRPPRVLLMGGSQGMGPIEKIVLALDKRDEVFEMVVAAGRNGRLYRRLAKLKAKLKKKLKIHSYSDNIAGLMQEAALLVSKPGGLTIAQALAYQLPIIFIDPIPGQEAKNASILLKHRAAVEAHSEEEVSLFVGQLLRTPAKVASMKSNMAPLAHPDAAARIAKIILERDPAP